MSLLTECKSIIEHGGEKKGKKTQIKSILMSVAAAAESPTSYCTEHSDAQHIQLLSQEPLCITEILEECILLHFADLLQITYLKLSTGTVIQPISQI